MPTISTLDEFLAYAKRTTDYEQRLPPTMRDEVFDLGRVRALLDALGNPQRSCPAVHVAGSKGKGSVSRLLEAIARGHGLRTGVFTSPHLERRTEAVSQRLGDTARV